MEKEQLITKLSVLFSHEIQQKWEKRNLHLSLKVKSNLERVVLSVYFLSPPHGTDTPIKEERQVIKFFIRKELSVDVSFTLNSDIDWKDDILDEILYTTGYSKDLWRELGEDWPLVNLSLDEFIKKMCT